MTPKQNQRLRFVFLLLIAFSGATALVLYALGENLLYFYSPSQVATSEAPQNHIFNIGGMVVDGSVKHGENAEVHFAITDYQHTVTVRYTGILPDLFREGQGIVVTGKLNGDSGNLFVAERVLAKHDENYMPPEVADMLKKNTSESAGARPVGIPASGDYTRKPQRP